MGSRGRLHRRLAPLLLACAAGCINAQAERGVEARWQALEPDAIVSGKTTRAEVLDMLGPPSQILSLPEGTAFYYMLEKNSTEGLILILYNTRKEATGYDRAVFFFDQQGVLTDHAISEAQR